MFEMMNSVALGFGNPTEWMIIGVVVLVLFGGSKIPEMMKGLGSGVKEFKKGIREDDVPAEKPEETTKTA